MDKMLSHWKTTTMPIFIPTHLANTFELMNTRYRSARTLNNPRHRRIILFKELLDLGLLRSGGSSNPFTNRPRR
jgi:hypothetical protein